MSRPQQAIHIVRAPGRVNLIGEHTDYNDGLVLPAAIDREIRIAFVRTDDREVRLTRLSDGDSNGFSLDADSRPTGTWTDYVAGTAAALQEAGLPVFGLRGVIASDLPENAGLSSSAAIELTAACALLDDAATIDELSLARICQRAENRYVGVQSGLMDQFAVACGQAGAAMLFDCRSFESRPIAMASPSWYATLGHPGRWAGPNTTFGEPSARRPSPSWPGATPRSGRSATWIRGC